MMKMLYYEAGRKGYLIFDENGRIPKIGFHLPEDMAGLWFPPFKIIDCLDFQKPARKVMVNMVGRKVLFEDGEVEFLFSLDRKRFFIKIKGKLGIQLRLCETPVWNSDILGWRKTVPRISEKEDKILIELKNLNTLFFIKSSGGLFSLKGNILKIKSLLPETVVCIGDEPLKSVMKAYEEERMRKEEYYHLVNNEKGARFWLKNMLIDMFLANEYGEGVIAGFPEFPWWFGVDTFFIGRCLLEMDLVDFFKKSFSNLLRYSEKGRIPHEVITNGVIYHKGNPIETSLFVILLEDYYEKTKDLTFVEENYPMILEGFKNLLKVPYPEGPGFVELEEVSSEHVVTLDNAVAAYRALMALSKLSKLLKDEKTLEWSLDFLKFYRENFMKDWFDEEKRLFWDYMIDEEKKFSGFFTQIFPLFFRLVNKNLAIRILNELKKIGLISERGLRHSLKGDEGGFYGKKEEKIWWISNALLKRTILSYGMNWDFSNLDEMFKHDMENVGMNHAIPEIVNMEGGCFAQAWSAYYPI